LVYLQDGILNVNQSFTFDVRELKTAQITLQVVARGVLGIEEALGHISSLCVLNLLEVQTWVLHHFPLFSRKLLAGNSHPEQLKGT